MPSYFRYFGSDGYFYFGQFNIRHFSLRYYVMLLYMYTV